MIAVCEWSAGGACSEPATLLVRSEGANDSGVMVLLMWDGWDRIPGPRPVYCLDHARHIMSGLPTLAPSLSAHDDGGRAVFTHG